MSGGAGQTPAEKKSLPTLLPYSGMLSTPGGGGGASSSGSGQGEEGNVKERIQQWIQQQAAGFLDKWAGPSHSNPAHQVVSNLKDAAVGIDPKSPNCLTSLDVSLPSSLLSDVMDLSLSLSLSLSHTLPPSPLPSPTPHSHCVRF